jgi:hypothetical protein
MSPHNELTLQFVERARTDREHYFEVRVGVLELEEFG